MNAIKFVLAGPEKQQVHVEWPRLANAHSAPFVLCVLNSWATCISEILLGLPLKGNQVGEIRAGSGMST